MTHAYNGDGVLIAQTTGSTTTRYTQDLVAPLSQILQLTHGTKRTDYVYGRERLMALEGTAQTWYGSDALGSVRQTLDATGAPLTALHYDPWGTPQRSAAPPSFGFTGERQDGTSGLVYLRARWYQPQHGRFLSRDPFDGWSEIPPSLHPYAYAHNDPVQRVDPTGKWACDWGYWYAKICAHAAERLLVAPRWKPRKADLDTLLFLFETEALPGGSIPRNNGYQAAGLTAAQERLEFVLWLTDDGQANFQIQFTDQGLRQAFRDSGLFADDYSNNQIAHFLTAVRLGYGKGNLYPDSEENAIACIIGHEKIGDPAAGSSRGTSIASNAVQCLLGGNRDDHALFRQAVAADRNGNAQERDCLITSLLPGLPEQHARWGADHPRVGNSIQDLRLSIKGWIFGQDIRDRTITTLKAASSWLRTNLR